jgi:predicted alpha-1,2-mannosidase
MKISKRPILRPLFPMVFLAALVSCAEKEQPAMEIKEVSPVDMVYPQLDTENSRWFLFSSASRPFGMVNLSPDTQLKGAWGSGYRYEIDTIKGFSHIHGWQLSGLSVMPVALHAENENTIFTDYFSKFSHDDEIVAPGYHSVQLQRYGIQAELTSTKRVGMHRIRYQKETKNAILLHLNMELGPCENKEGELQQLSQTEFKGTFVVGPTSRKPKPHRVFFHLALDTPVQQMEKDTTTGNYKLLLQGKEDPVLMKAAISYTSAANAKLNMERELDHWDFDRVVKESKQEWNGLLERISVTGGTEQAQRRFYTDLWHALQGRRTISDANGAYPDNTQDQFRIGQLPVDANGTPKFNHYNSDAFWGAQWTINTLWGLVYPEIKQDFVHSLLQYAKDGGLVPRGPSGGNYTYVMTGAPSTPFIVSAVQQGLITHPLDSIYQTLKKNHEPGGIMEKAGYEHYTSIGGGLRYYLEKGFVPFPIPEGKFGAHQDGASLTMEYAYQDYTLAQLAKKLGLQEDHDRYMRRSLNYKNVYDPETGWMRPKNVDGNWLADFDPYRYENGFNEANGAQATWFVPHDINGLAQLMGGTEKTVERLHLQFQDAQKQGFTAGTSHARESHPEWSRIPINYGNQPSMQTAFIFHKLHRPDLTQYWSRQVVERVFSGLGPATGYNGDEDQGLMGSLAVLMKIGLFQMNGGTEHNPEYQIGSPIFDKVSIQLHPDFYPGKTIDILAKGSPNGAIYADTILWNGARLENAAIRHQDIIRGGILELKMKQP